MKYYAIINDVQRGPFNLDELSDAGCARPHTCGAKGCKIGKRRKMWPTYAECSEFA